MKQSIQLRLGQSLTMTPQLQQAIRLLQLSTVELNMEVQQALESNMMLELAEEDADSADEEAYGTPEDTPSAEAEGESDVYDGAGQERLDAGADGETPGGQETAESGAGVNERIPDELPVDSVWEDTYDAGPASGPAASAEGEDYDLANSRSASESLQDHLLWQLNLAPMSDTDNYIATAIIDALSADGYLTVPLADIHAAVAAELEQLDPSTELEMDEVEAVLRGVQAFEPTGVGARDLRECLLLQLAQLPPETPWLSEAGLLVRQHLDVLAAHDYNGLMRRLHMDRQALTETVKLIQSLNPRPGSQMGSPPNEYITPDVFVRRKSGAWQVELNAEAVPSLRVNRRYAGYIRRSDNSADNTSLRTHLQEARWFIKSLQSRSETLLRVATAIVERQREFLEYGDEGMKPLVLHDIAETLGMHESTISRVTTRKYMHTPRGIFELKYFFSSHVGADSGSEASSTAIRALIRKLIGGESPNRPLSDSKIADMLAGQGISVARRTVAKYREAMAIPPSNERKRLA